MGNQSVRPEDANQRVAYADAVRCRGLCVAAFRQTSNGQGFETVCIDAVKGPGMAGNR